MKLNCPDCHKAMTEVNKAELSKQDLEKFPSVSSVVDMYPKTSTVDGHEYNEHRYYCLNCKKEFTFDELDNTIREVPEDSQFRFDPKKELLTKRK